MSITKKTSEAPESSAGDNYHVLWTVKRSFDLLNYYEDSLKAITIEGVETVNAEKLDPDGSNLLGVDIAEYYGGECFEDAKKVVISQLKYSTRRVAENWTFSLLYKGKKSNSTDGSLLHRLAQTYKAFLDEYGRDLVLEKLSLKLVSNRNFSKKQKLLLSDIQAFLNQQKTPTYNRTLIKAFCDEKAVLKKLQTVTKLSSSEFTDFLRLLDFEDCGTKSSYYQELEIIKAIKNVGIVNKNQKDSLFRMIWRKMLPEAQDRGENKITEIDLLYCFQMSLERLLPIPQKFEAIEHLVERTQVKTILDKIITNKTGLPICLHAGAGIGKSTISQLIKKSVPAGSEVILFDCYGAGEYLNPSDSRHLHKEAFLQISNEMAKRIGSPFLLSTENDSYIFIREFKRRIEKAVNILKCSNPSAVLILIIDAADNSIAAAEKRQTKSFIQDLLEESIPDGFRLIVTSRTHRVSSLNLPKNYIDIPLKPFDYQETKNYLTYYFPQSTEKEIQNFHQLTNGIPRVQFYALCLKQKGIKEVINYLKPNGKLVEDLIEDKIIEASKRLGNNGQVMIDSFFQALISLPRPVPLSYIGSISGLNKELLQDLATDIWNGVVLSNNALSFRDEDFENFISQKYEKTKELSQKIANLFLEKANEDEYASINLGIVLFEAGYKNKLKNIVLQDEYKKFPADPIRKKEVYIERTKLAMKVSNELDDKLTFFKLAFIAADVAKTDRALRNLLIQNAGLVASLGENDSLQKIYLQSDGTSWAGSFHFQLAAIYSRKPNSIEIAKKHLKTAKKWVQWFLRQPESRELRNYRITIDDIVYGAEAEFRINGLLAVSKWLLIWKDKAVFKATIILLNNILKYSDKQQILNCLKPIDAPIYAKLIILEKISFYGINFFNLDEIADRLLKILSKGVNFKSYLLPSILSFCELFIQSSLSNKRKTLDILDIITINLPDRVPSFIYSGFGDNDSELRVELFLRKATLKASLTNTPLVIADLHPEKLKKISEETDYKMRNALEQERRNFNNFYKHAIAIYQFKADIFVGKNVEETNAKFLDICKSIKDDWNFRYYDSYRINNRLKFLALGLVETILFLKEKEEKLKILIESFENKKQNYISLRIAIAERITGLNGMNITVFKLLNEVDDFIQQSTLEASSMMNFYLQLAKIANSIDENISKFYFDKAIDAVSEIDEEAQEQIKCLYNLAQLGIPKENPQLAFEFARFVEYSKARLDGYDHFPLKEGIKGITHLDCATAFATICRWNHRYVTEITEEILPILKISLQKGFLKPSIGGAMLPLNIYYWKSFVEYIEVLIREFDNEGSRKQKSIFVKNLIRDIQLNCSPNEIFKTTQSIYRLIKNGKYVDNELVFNFKKYWQFMEGINKQEISPKPESLKRNKEEIIEEDKVETFDFNFNIIDVNSSTSLNEALKKITANDDFFYSRGEIDDFFSQLQDICSPQDYISHLDALININPDLITFYAFKKALKERLEAWSYHPLVKQWKKQKFKTALKLWFSDFRGNDMINYDGIKDFAQLFSIDNTELSKIILNIIPEKIEELSAYDIYQTITFFKDKLSPKENEVLITWVLPRWNAKIKDDFADGVWYRNQAPPTSADKVIAQTIRYILGHPDKRIRWRGIHVLRRLINSGDTAILQILLADQNNANCYPFQHQQHTFFWISAKLYLWICIARMAKENPQKIALFKNEVIQELQNKEFPHVLILSLVKQTCLSLHSFDNSIFSTEEFNIVLNLLTSPYPPVKEERLKKEQRKYSNESGEWKFDFDSLDTLPYWYNSLGRCFNLTERDVADLADRHISQKWEYTGNVGKDNHVQVSSNQYGLVSNGHGQMPTVENLQLYYEYHAMFCAANDLLLKEPLLKTEPNDWYSWEFWLTSQGLTFPNFWLSDVRDALPLQKRFWTCNFSKFDEKWKNEIDETLYDKVIGLTLEDKIKNIAVYGGYTRYFGENYEGVTIRSAIVTTKSSQSLLRALQTAKDNHDYRIPLEDDDLEINKSNFTMIGWLKDISSEYEGLDKHDPFANEVGRNYIVLGKEVTKLFDITYNNYFKTTSFDGKIIASYQNWSNLTERKNYSKFESEGRLFKVDVEFLLKFLKKRDMSLILECSISRTLKEPDYDFSKRERKNNAKLYLIQPNGEVKTIRGRNYKIG